MKRLTQLDGLRGIAALIVVIFHLSLIAQPFLDTNSTGDAWWWMSETPLRLATDGTQAVLLFFVLSGLVVALPALRKGFSWRKYFASRFLRLYIPAWGALVLAVVSGSLHYLAPEVLRGAAPSAASDLYSLGVLLFRLLTGAYPFPAHDLADLMRAQDENRRAPIASLRAEVPPSVIKAIDAALQADPEKRPASAMAFEAFLLAAPARPPAWRWLGACFALLAAAVGIAWLFARPATATWQTDLAFHRDGAALSDGAPIALGDKLTLTFRSSHTSYVYVFDDDGSGQAAVLYPLQNVQPTNPLAADHDYQLPGRQGEQAVSWQVSSIAERERFVVIATDAPQPQLDAVIAAWQHAGAAGPSRGALRLAPAPTESEISSAALRTELARLTVDGLHVRRWQYMFPHKAG